MSADLFVVANVLAVPAINSVRVPGFVLQHGKRRHEVRFMCHDKGCTWDGPGRWLSRSRRDPAELLRACRQHAEKHHGELSLRKFAADWPGMCERLGLNPSGHPRTRQAEEIQQLD